MVEKLVITVFETESKAYEGLNAIKTLDRQADLALYAIAVIAKDLDGQVNVRQAAEPGPIGALFGTSLGAIVGVLGGPAGVAAGALGGYWGGVISDLNRLGIDLEFLDDVGTLLQPGKAAVVASIDEYWTTPLDTAIEPLGGTVFRKLRTEVIDEQIDRDIRETQSELQALQDEYAAAAAEQQAKIQAKINATQNKLDAKIDAATRWVEEHDQQTKAKVDSLQSQAQAASDRRKAEIEQQIRAIQSSATQRIEKLRGTANSAKEPVAV